MGLGKTGVAYSIWVRLSKSRRAETGRADASSNGGLGPALLLAGNNALYTWWRLAPFWGLQLPVRISGTPAVRMAKWKQCTRNADAFVCCTRELFVRDMAAGYVPIFWQVIFTDEAHKHANRKTKVYAALKRLQSPWFIICTGSPVKRGPQDLWGLLHLLDRRTWSSYWRFIDSYVHTVDQVFGGKAFLGPKNVPELQRQLAGYFIRRTKLEVASELPQKQREPVYIDMTDWQRKVYVQLLEQSLAELTEGSLIVSPTVLARIVRLRQLLVCPKLLDPGAPDGAGIDWIVEKLEEADSTHMCIYTPFPKVFPFLRARLESEGYDPNHIIELRGGMDTLALDEALTRFKKNAPHGSIALVSIKFAESFDLDTASWGVFLGAEYNPEENKQAEDRQHRLTTVLPVNFYYIQHNNAVTDQEQWEILNSKTVYTNRTLHNVDNVRRMLQQGLGSLK
jgi:SNF2 family DNA or RNA helicase